MRGSSQCRRVRSHIFTTWHLLLPLQCCSRPSTRKPRTPSVRSQVGPSAPSPWHSTTPCAEKRTRPGNHHRRKSDVGRHDLHRGAIGPEGMLGQAAATQEQTDTAEFAKEQDVPPASFRPPLSQDGPLTTEREPEPSKSVGPRWASAERELRLRPSERLTIYVHRRPPRFAGAVSRSLAVVSCQPCRVQSPSPSPPGRLLSRLRAALPAVRRPTNSRECCQ
jgi:hypothetical protein